MSNTFRKIFLLNSCVLAYECVVLFNCSVSDAIKRSKLFNHYFILTTLGTGIIEKLASIGSNVI